ncbi:chorismate synthase [Clostridiaceae bacterium]|nr:chorismate synthase [Lachnospiraceae bacterium]NBH16698.1 chorismate synthase [Clostridiaceae bacterium]
MAGSIWGTIFRITTWGESHGKGVGVTIDGCPAGLSLCQEDIQKYLDRRKPGQSPFTTARKEEDQVEILSGVFEGKTTGTPIGLMVRNRDQKSRDYHDIMDVYRPGHADYCFDAKYGFRDYRGGGRSSGRETIGRVAAGAVACKLLAVYGIQVNAYTKSIGEIEIDSQRFDLKVRDENRLYMPDAVAAREASAYLEDLIKEQDSAGGVVECVIQGVPAGVGEPVFDKLDACLAKAIMSIGAVKGFEVGDGFGAARSRGSVNNDCFYVDSSGKVKKKTNHSGGILGGISDGSDIVFRAAFKPTPSIAQNQETVNRAGENVEIVVKGRHDPIVVPRAVVVVEAMAALTVADLLLMGKSSKLEGFMLSESGMG